MTCIALPIFEGRGGGRNFSMFHNLSLIAHRQGESSEFFPVSWPIFLNPRVYIQEAFVHKIIYFCIIISLYFSILFYLFLSYFLHIRTQTIFEGRGEIELFPSSVAQAYSPYIGKVGIYPNPMAHIQGESSEVFQVLEPVCREIFFIFLHIDILYVFSFASAP